MSREILKGTSKISILTLVSRVLGFIWNLVFARVFGAGAIADCFFVAFKIPNLLRSILGEGALSAAFVPVFSSELTKDRSQAQETLRAVAGLLLIGGMILSILGLIYTKNIIELIAPGYQNDQERFELCLILTRITLPYIIFVSFVALISGALNSVKIYGAAPISQIVMNLVMLVTCLSVSFFEPRLGITLLSISVLVGGFAQIFVQLPGLRKAGLKILPSSKLFTASSRKVLWLMIPACFGAAIYQISIFINTMLASLLPTGSISWLFYADRISQFPIGILTIAITSVLLPELSRSQATNNHQEYNKSLNDSLRFLSFLLIPASAGLIVLAEPIVAVLFQRGEFSAFDTNQTAFAIQATCFGLWGISCQAIVSRGFLARQDTLTPSLLGIFSLIINCLLALALMGQIGIYDHNWIMNLIVQLQQWISVNFPTINLAHAGLALAAGLSLTISLLVSIIVLDRKLLNWSLKPFLKASIIALMASLIMYLTIAELKLLIANQLTLLLIAIPIGALAYLVGNYILGGQEIRELARLVMKKTAR